MRIDSVNPAGVRFDLHELDRERMIHRIARLMALLHVRGLGGDEKLMSSLRRAELLVLMGNNLQAKNLLDELERTILQRTFPAYRERGDRRSDRNINDHEGERITLVDRSNDPSVSFKYPTPVPADSSLLFIASHERQHVQSIIGDAVLKGKIAHVYVRYFTSYDSKGRLIFVGGLTWGEIVDERR